ncbi:VOC family protein [Micromonospora sp. DT15]|uniref:VOC family protein n=1 Tax=Micromonospora sp. DT15 TaxID=3393445 RepID=UPI003CE9F255
MNAGQRNQAAQVGADRGAGDPPGREVGQGAVQDLAVRVDGYRPSTWPSGERLQQIHFDLAVDEPDDLDDAEARAIELGAVKEEQQPAPERFRVLRDPAGHPFCLRG